MALIEFLQGVSGAMVNHWQTILIASTFLLVLYSLTPSRSMKSWYGDICGPKPLPVLGHLLDTIKYKGQLHLQVHEYFLKYGKVFAMTSFLGKIPNLVIADPEMLKDIFVKEFDSFRDRPLILKPPEPLASMLTRAQGEKWKRIRSTLTPAFSALKMKQMFPVMNSCCDILLKKLGEVADKEQSVNIVKFQQALTMDLILSAVFGLQANSQDNPDDPFIKAARQALKQSFSKKILLGSLLPFGIKLMEKFPSIWLSSTIPLLKMTEKIISAKKTGNGSSSRKDMLDLMLAASDDPSVPESKKLSDTEVLAQSIIFLAAGYETSSGTLSLTCYHIATHPDVQDKLQQEIDGMWTDDEQLPTYEIVNELPYLDMVISETLRLYPPGFMISRGCTKACVVKGVKIPKDSPILIPVYSVQRDPSVFPDPEKFDPERFAPSAKQSHNPYSFLPFGHGPHSCIGMRFAKMQMRLVLARMLRKYRLDVTPDTKIPPDVKAKATLGSPEINLRIVSRTKERYA